MEKEQIRIKALAEAEGRPRSTGRTRTSSGRELLLKAKEERNKAVQVAQAVLTSLGGGQGHPDRSDQDGHARWGNFAHGAGSVRVQEGTRFRQGV